MNALVALVLAATVGASQPPSPTPAVWSNEQEGSPQESAQEAEAAQGEAKQAPLTVTLDGPIAIEKSEAERERVAAEVEEAASSEWWLLVWTGALAVATLILAVTTAFLARYTYKLWKHARESGEQQAADTKASLLIAKANSDAAGLAASATYRQAISAINVERPWLYVSDVAFPYSGSHYVNVQYTNYGRTPAILLRLALHLDAVETLPDEPRYEFFPARGEILRPGETKGWPIEFGVARSDGTRWIWGQVLYRDCFGGICEAGFVGTCGGGKGISFGGPPAYEYNRYWPNTSLDDRGTGLQFSGSEAPPAETT